jgi:hypothetical protein
VRVDNTILGRLKTGESVYGRCDVLATLSAYKGVGRFEPIRSLMTVMPIIAKKMYRNTPEDIQVQVLILLTTLPSIPWGCPTDCSPQPNCVHVLIISQQSQCQLALVDLIALGGTIPARPVYACWVRYPNCGDISRICKVCSDLKQYTRMARLLNARSRSYPLRGFECVHIIWCQQGFVS